MQYLEWHMDQPQLRRVHRHDSVKICAQKIRPNWSQSVCIDVVIDQFTRLNRADGQYVATEEFLGKRGRQA